MQNGHTVPFAVSWNFSVAHGGSLGSWPRRGRSLETNAELPSPLSAVQMQGPGPQTEEKQRLKMAELVIHSDSLRLQWCPAADQGTGYKYMEEHVVLTENHLLEDSFEEHSSTTVWRQKCPKSTGRTQHHWVCHVLFYLWPMTWHSLVPRELLCDEWWERFWVFIRSSEESKSGWD